jgi:hypothetical protein
MLSDLLGFIKTITTLAADTTEAILHTGSARTYKAADEFWCRDAFVPWFLNTSEAVDAEQMCPPCECYRCVPKSSSAAVSTPPAAGEPTCDDCQTPKACGQHSACLQIGRTVTVAHPASSSPATSPSAAGTLDEESPGAELGATASAPAPGHLLHTDIKAAATGLRSWILDEPCAYHDLVTWAAIVDRLEEHAGTLAEWAERAELDIHPVWRGFAKAKAAGSFGFPPDPDPVSP